MKQSRIRSVLLAIALAVPVGLDAQAGLDRDEIDRISRTVVRIAALDGGEIVSTGSGTIVDPTGLIYTNRHVIEDGDDWEVHILDDVNELPVPTYRARMIGYSMEVDFALLQVDRDADGRPVDVSTLDLPHVAPSEPEVARGDRVYVFGYPDIGAGYLALTEGAVTTIRNGTLEEQRLPVWFQTDAQILLGNNGGLAVNARGEIIGIPTAVRTEDATGGRLGGILSIGAVRTALAAGLETDPARIAAGRTSPLALGGRLDHGEEPFFGSVDLAAGFTPDPHTVEMVGGGEIDVAYLGGGCTGHAATAPDFRFDWSGRADELRVFFSAEDGGDTTLLISLPDGEWVCNDDADVGGLDPLIVLDHPAEGRYDVWVASYDADDFVDGFLYVTELDLDPLSLLSRELDPAGEPYFGEFALQPGFTPDPYEIGILAGGSVDVSYLGGECLGYAAAAPDFRFEWRGRTDALRILFEADEEDDDPVLVIRAPDGSWLCGDDTGFESLNPSVELTDPAEGTYDVWVGTFNRGEYVDGTVSVRELGIRTR